MIGSFKHKGLKKLYESGDRSKIGADMLDKIENILFSLEGADDVSELRLPSYKLHQLKGDLKGYWSITVKANWRITFRFENKQALDVDLVDYH